MKPWYSELYPTGLCKKCEDVHILVPHPHMPVKWYDGELHDVVPIEIRAKSERTYFPKSGIGFRGITLVWERPGITPPPLVVEEVADQIINLNMN